MKRILLTISMMLFVGGCWGGEAPSSEQIAAWVAALGSNEFDVREDAEAKLKQAGWHARGPLEKALRETKDLEIRRRAERALVGLPDGPSALYWLAYYQEVDGHWDSRKHGSEVDCDVESTALALLAFLGASHTEKVGIHKANVKRCVAWLKSKQMKDGSFRNTGETETSGLTHALVMVAMCEAAGMGNVEDTIASAQAAVDYAQRHQSEKKGLTWGFGEKAKDAKTTPLHTVVFTFAFKSAKVCGMKVEASTFDGIIAYLDSVEDKDRKEFVGLNKEELSRNECFGLAVARQFMGANKEALNPFVERLMRNPEDLDVVGSYAASLACFQQGGELWGKWEKRVRERILKTQVKEGEAEGSWAPSEPLQKYGRVISTSLNALALEVYYRYKQFE